MSIAAKTIHIVGAGPAGLMAAERLAQAGAKVTVHERMPSPGRKLLMAGRGGLNLTHSEDQAAFEGRYGEAAGAVSPWLDAFSPDDLAAWAEGLGQATFTGSSGRVFPRAMKASPLLRAWLARLNGLVVLALGGASWPKLGSDGGWVDPLEAAGVAVVPLRPSNMGFDVAWSEVVRSRFAGQPLKGVALTFGDRTVRGEAVVTAYGLEGGAVYTLSAALREAIAAEGSALLTIDLRPDLSIAALAARLEAGRGKDSTANWLRKAGGLSPVAAALLREVPGELPQGADKLARRIKALRLKLTGIQGLERAISTAGGVALDAVDAGLMLSARPGVFVAGEMLDWEAPTGGYLLQASMASGVVAAQGVERWLAGGEGGTA